MEILSFIKKINRGLILTVAVILAVIVYLICLYSARANDRAEIKAVTENFLEDYSDALILSDTAVYAKENLTAEDFEKSGSEAFGELKGHFADNEICYQSAKDNLSTVHFAQYMLGEPIKSLKTEITKIEDMNFNGDTASATVKLTLACTGPEKLFYEGDEDANGKNVLSADMVFQKIDGKWKIYYFDAYSVFSIEGDTFPTTVAELF